MLTMQDLLVAIGVVINALPGGLYALTFGFASVPTADRFYYRCCRLWLAGRRDPHIFSGGDADVSGNHGAYRSGKNLYDIPGGCYSSCRGTDGVV